MPTQHLDHANLSRLAEKGQINATHIVGQPGGWAIQIDFNNREHVLTAQRSGNVRLFKKLETLVSYLHDLGIEHFEVDSSTWNPQQTATYQRPDRSQALKRAHEAAAAYDAWFIEQIEASRRAPAPALDDEDVEKFFAVRRAELNAKKR